VDESVWVLPRTESGVGKTWKEKKATHPQGTVSGTSGHFFPAISDNKHKAAGQTQMLGDQSHFGTFQR
jgi:hypothetical protein